MNFGKRGRVGIAVGLRGFGSLLVPYVADALEEQQWRMYPFQSVRSTADPRSVFAASQSVDLRFAVSVWLFFRCSKLCAPVRGVARAKLAGWVDQWQHRDKLERKCSCID